MMGIIMTAMVAPHIAAPRAVGRVQGAILLRPQSAQRIVAMGLGRDQRSVTMEIMLTVMVAQEIAWWSSGGNAVHVFLANAHRCVETVDAFSTRVVMMETLTMAMDAQKHAKWRLDLLVLVVI